MKAAIVEKPGVLVVREIPQPEVHEYDALCELLYGATCTGTDQHIIHGRFPFPCINFPTVLGHESIGRVVQVGAKVRNLKLGDLVTRVGTPPVGGVDVSWGGFAEFGIVRDHWAMKEDGRPRPEWDENRVNQPLPPGTDPAAATMVITWRETLSFATRMGFRPGMRVLIVGSGGNGLSYVAHARNLGAAFVAMAGSARRKGVAEALGAQAYLDYAAADFAAELQQVAGDGFDFVIDAVGKAATLDTVLGAVRYGGTVAIYGIDEFGACRLTPQKARGTFTFFNGGYDEEETHERVVAFMRSGALDASKFMDLAQPFPLERIGEAFEAVAKKRLVKALVKLSANA